MIKQEDMNSVIKYIIYFLLGKENFKIKNSVLYLTKQEIFNVQEKEKIIIIKSNFFLKYGHKDSLPTLPLQEIDGIPFMYGKNDIEYCNGNILIHADFIASAYIMLSRYEEMINGSKRDVYGNYSAQNSILYRSGNLHRPLIDEYSLFILNHLSSLGYNVKLNQPGFNTVCFSHDVDIPWMQFDFKDASKTVIKSILKDYKPIFYPYLNWLGIYQRNPCNTFEYMFDIEQRICSIDNKKYYIVCFILGNKKSSKYNNSYVMDKKTGSLIGKIQKYNSFIGMHTSYLAAENFEEIKKEKITLENILGKDIIFNRNHYLRQLSPMDLEHYMAAGIKDDYTAGYNESPGFKLGTCRVVKWINPQTCQLTELNIHPLNIMEGSLSGDKPYQMELSYEDARKCCFNIIDTVYKYNGDLCILWHNNSFVFSRGNYQKKLYEDVLEYIELKVVKSLY